MLSGLILVPAFTSAQFTPVQKQKTKAQIEAEIRAQVRKEMERQEKDTAKSVSWQSGTVAGVRKTASWQPSQAPNSQVQSQIADYAPSSQVAVQTAISPSGCEQAISAAEKKYNLPPYLLQAIALTESGTNNRPNPLAMNIKGKSYYARSAQEVINIVGQHGSRSSIDIGCAQINLKYHGERFPDWRVLITPAGNSEYAAFHLTELYRERGSWSRAVAAYHSRTPWRGTNYACLVSRKYGQIFGDNRKGCGPNIEMLAAYLYKNVRR